MATVIGLMSGKEFVVEDKSYRLLKVDGSIVFVFKAQDQDRLITVHEDNIEYFDEPNTKERIESLQRLTEATAVPEEIGVEYV